MRQRRGIGPLLCPVLRVCAMMARDDWLPDHTGCRNGTLHGHWLATGDYKDREKGLPALWRRIDKKGKKTRNRQLCYFLIVQPVQESFTSDILMCSLLIFRSPNSFKASVNAATGTPSNHSKVKKKKHNYPHIIFRISQFYILPNYYISLF